MSYIMGDAHDVIRDGAHYWPPPPPLFIPDIVPSRFFTVGAPLLFLTGVLLLSRLRSVLAGIHALRLHRTGGPVPAGRRAAAPTAPPPAPPRRTSPVSTMVVLGSGGHTAEMVRLLSSLAVGSRYAPLTYVVSASDTTSLQFVTALAAEKHATTTAHPPQSVCVIPRAREVGQSYVTSVVTTLHAAAVSFGILLRRRPQLLLCNGPGTCVPLVVWAFLGRVVCGVETQVVYVESFCRVRSLSLTGKIVYPLVDRFVVHWPELAADLPLAECLPTEAGRPLI